MSQAVSMEELATAAAQEYERQLAEREVAVRAREIEIQKRWTVLQELETPRRFRVLDATGEAETITHDATSTPRGIAEVETLRAEIDSLRREIRRGRTPAADSWRNMSTPHIKLKEIVDTIPQFNGHNISVLQFTRACKRALEMLPAPVSPDLEANLVRLIRMKLQGHAYLVVEDETILTVESLRDLLKTTFMPNRTVNYYRGALANLHKKSDEHVLDYISRTKDLRQAIMEEEMKVRKEYFSEIEKCRIDDEALESFINGLPPEYRLPLRMEDCTILTEAFGALIRINQQHERDIERSRMQTKTRTPTANIAIAQRAPCNLCGKTGHIADRCWHNKNNWPKHEGRATPPRELQASSSQPAGTDTCNYCKKPGHMKFDCELKKRNDARRQPTLGKPGNGYNGSSNQDANRTESPQGRPSTTPAIIELA